jgi:hypothetical protein
VKPFFQLSLEKLLEKATVCRRNRENELMERRVI